MLAHPWTLSGRIQAALRTSWSGFVISHWTKTLAVTPSRIRNRGFVLAERRKGKATADTLRLEFLDPPEAGKGKMLLQNEHLSLDPYILSPMSDEPSYAEPVELGDVMIGGTVAPVVTSDVDGFGDGDWVQTFGGWEDHAV